MPTVSRWFIKLGMIYFLLSVVLQLLLTIHTQYNINEWLSFAYPAFYHMLMVGWITQIIFGVSIWMFPRYSREQPRGREWLNWVALVMLNIGLVLRIIFEPLQGIRPSEYGDSIILVGSAVLQFSGVAAYVINIWKRVREK
jgi:heme/copper-type cytochrome/quinol oxidase subunit 1